VRHAVGTGRGAVRESWRRLAVAKRKVLTRVANSPERNNQVGGVVVLRCNLGCFGTKCFATRSQDTLTRRVTTTQRWPVVVEVFLTRLVHVVGRCGGRPGGRGWRSLRVAAAAGSPHPPLSDRRTGCTVSSWFESLYLTLIRTSHTSTRRRGLLRRESEVLLMGMYSVELRLTPDSLVAEFRAYVSDRYVRAAQSEADKAGKSAYAVHGDEVLEAVLAVMWVECVPSVYQGAVRVNSEGRLHFRYHVNCIGRELRVEQGT